MGRYQLPDIRHAAALAPDLKCCAVALVLTLAACSQRPPAPPWPGFAGDAKRGATLIASAGCGKCHVIPGIEGATGVVGPTLAGFGSRTTVAGLLPNNPEGLILWVRRPQTVLPGNAMPNPGLSSAAARDVAAYLHQVR